MICTLCRHEHKGSCYPNCPVCCPKPGKVVRKAATGPAPKAEVAVRKGTQSERNQRYRAAHRDRYNEYMREYRRKKRK